MRRVLRVSSPAGAVGLLLSVFSGGAAAQGTEFNLSCNADEVLVGISGRQGYWMEGIAARCRSVDLSGELGTGVRSTDYQGGTAGTQRTFDCSPTEVMVGYRGSQGSNGYVLHVDEVVCAPWQASTRTAGAPTRAVSAFERKSGPGEGIVASCSQGKVGTRLRGRSGQYLDRLIDMGCSYAAGATTPHLKEGLLTEPDGDTRSIRPITTQTTRPAITATGVPSVRLASPRPLVLNIGSSYSALNLSGAHLRRVTAASIVKSDGQVAGGFNVRFASRNRTDDRLLLSLIAGKPAAPGNYSLRLSYELDDPRPQSSPGTSPRKPVIRMVMVPMSTLTIRAQAMTPKITSTTPESPQRGREYVMTAAIADVPGKEVVSITRFTPSHSDLSYCDFQGTYHSPDESHIATWRGEHKLEILFSPGALIPRGTSCALRFSLRTRNELGEEFHSWPDAKVIVFQPAAVDSRKAYPVSNTWELKKYLRFNLQPYTAVGACSGTSPGTSGFIPVGVLRESNDINLRIRSGPVGTKCTWMLYATGLRSGWEMRMIFEKRQVGSKCDSGIETSAGGSFRFDRDAGLYHQGGQLTLAHNNPAGEVPPYDLESAAKYFRYTNLTCSPTVTNDHGVTMRMVSAELVGDGGQNCTWKCGVVD